MWLRSHRFSGLQTINGYRERTIFMGCNRILAVRTLIVGFISVLAAGSHMNDGLQELGGCGRTLVMGCMNQMAVRNRSLGCTDVLAAGFAVFVWVALPQWLPGSQFSFGLHCHNGCRVRT